MVEIIFLMLVLKLPILYLVGVVWWAVRAEAPPPEPARLPARRFQPRGPRHNGPDRRDRALRRTARTPAR